MKSDLFKDSGIFLLDKCEGLSSAADLNRLKKKLKLSKVGHAGTLDPMATGLLVCLANSATRLASFAEKGRKIYSGSIRFGVITDTDDIKGNILEERDNLPSYNSVLESSGHFLGEIEQFPPSVSAVKINGERAYRIARRGETPDIKARKVFIHNFQLSEKSANEVNFRIECNSGTYIRSIARDLGEKLTCGAALSALRREYSHPFSVSQARRIDDITVSDMISWTDLFPEMKKVSLQRADAQKILNGDMREIGIRIGDIIREQINSVSETERVIYYGEEDSRPLGILNKNEDRWEIAVNLS